MSNSSLDLLFSYKDHKYSMSEWFAVYMEKEVSQVLQEISDEEYEGSTPSGLLFCGCEVCYLREVMVIVVALALEGMAKGELASVPT